MFFCFTIKIWKNYVCLNNVLIINKRVGDNLEK